MEVFAYVGPVASSEFGILMKAKCQGSLFENEGESEKLPPMYKSKGAYTSEAE